MDSKKDLYGTYNGVEGFQQNNIPFTVVTNSWQRRVQIVFQLEGILKGIYPYVYESQKKIPNEMVKGINKKYFGNTIKYGNKEKLFQYFFSLPKNIFFTPEDEPKTVGDDSSTQPTKYQKPNPKGVENAKKWLSKTFDLGENARIIGVGNTQEDMVAYRQAGIESVLGLWGVPDRLKNYARIHWEANYKFETFEDFNSWVTGCGFHSMKLD